MVKKMKYKKILVIALIALLACVAVNAVQAEPTGYTENIRGIDFNIPKGFIESKHSVKDNVTKEMNATTDVRGFYNDDKDTIIISVIEYGGKFDSSLTGDGESVTIKNMDGRLKQDDDGKYHFKYFKDNHYVSISAPDKKLIEEIIK